MHVNQNLLCPQCPPDADIIPVSQMRSQDSEKGSDLFQIYLSKPSLSHPTPFTNAPLVRMDSYLFRSSSPPSESPYLQSWGPAPRVRTGVAGTLRPSKLEALLGSERVGLSRNRQAQVGVQVRHHNHQQAVLPVQAQDPPPGSRGREGKGFTLTWWGWPQSSAGSSDPHKDLTGVASMGFAAQGCPQIRPAAGPRPWVVRGARPGGSSHGAPLGERWKVGEKSKRGGLMGCGQGQGE